jgi:hypothetical protein
VLLRFCQQLFVGMHILSKSLVFPQLTMYEVDTSRNIDLAINSWPKCQTKETKGRRHHGRGQHRSGVLVHTLPQSTVILVYYRIFGTGIVTYRYYSITMRASRY